MDHPLLPSVKVWFLDFYKGEMKDLLAKAKFGGEFSLFEQMIPKDLPLESAVLVPVPQGRWRFANRGFNQSEIIAQTLALRHNLKVSNCLKDLSGREAMHFKSRQGRLARGKKIMVNRRLVSVLKTRQVVLVDDILTTGATVKACVDALADSGITVQVIVVLAYTKRKRTTV